MVFCLLDVSLAWHLVLLNDGSTPDIFVFGDRWWVCVIGLGVLYFTYCLIISNMICWTLVCIFSFVSWYSSLYITCVLFVVCLFLKKSTQTLPLLLRLAQKSTDSEFNIYFYQFSAFTFATSRNFLMWLLVFFFLKHFK